MFYFWIYWQMFPDEHKQDTLHRLRNIRIFLEYLNHMRRGIRRAIRVVKRKERRFNDGDFEQIISDFNKRE